MIFIMVHFRDALDGPPTSWVPPCISPSLIPLLIVTSSSSEHEPAHIPLAGVARILVCVLAGGVGNRAHIPQTRGGAHGQFVVCS
jgi:hypothetical protein